MNCSSGFSFLKNLHSFFGGGHSLLISILTVFIWNLSLVLICLFPMAKNLYIFVDHLYLF